MTNAAKREIKRALISVYDKTGLEDLARALGDAGVEIVSTGSTAKRIADAGVPVTEVAEVTGFPETPDQPSSTSGGSTRRQVYYRCQARVRSGNKTN